MPTPNTFESVEEGQERIVQFQERYERIAKPLRWKFTRRDLERVLKRIAQAKIWGLSRSPNFSVQDDSRFCSVVAADRRTSRGREDLDRESVCLAGFHSLLRMILIQGR